MRMKQSSSARGIPQISAANTVPITRRRQSLTVSSADTSSSSRRPSLSWRCTVEQWNFGANGGTSGGGTFVARSLRDAMRELARPQMQLCFGPNSAAAAAAATIAAAAGGDIGLIGIGTTTPNSATAAAGNSSSSSSPFSGGRRMSRRSQSPSASAILLGSALASAIQLQQQQQRHSNSCHHQLCANRSPSVSGASIAPGMGGRRGSERVGRLERSNSLLGGRGAGGGSSHLPFLPELTPQQVANLRRSWKHVNTKGLYDVIRRAFRRVESSNSNARAAFRQHDPPSPATGGQQASTAEPPSRVLRHQQQHSTVAAASAGAEGAGGGCGVMEHTRYFLALLDRIIDGDQEDAERELKLVGARHVPSFEHFGLGVAELERLGEALAESFFKLDGIRQSKETTKVWRMLIAHIIDHIRDGFETELRLHRRRTSALLAGSGGPAVMAMAPLESRFCKRNSVPSPRKQSSQSSGSSAALAAAAAASNVGASGATVGAGTFLRAEFANLTRKLSNL